MADEGIPVAGLKDNLAKLRERVARGDVPIEDGALFGRHGVEVNGVAPDEPPSVLLVHQVRRRSDRFREARDELFGKVGRKRVRQLHFATQRIRRLLEEKALVRPAARRANLDEMQHLRQGEHGVSALIRELGDELLRHVGCESRPLRLIATNHRPEQPSRDQGIPPVGLRIASEAQKLGNLIRARSRSTTAIDRARDGCTCSPTRRTLHSSDRHDLELWPRLVQPGPRPVPTR